MISICEVEVRDPSLGVGLEGTDLIVAPPVLTVEVDPNPKSFSADTLTLTNSSKTRLKGHLSLLGKMTANILIYIYLSFIFDVSLWTHSIRCTWQLN